MRGEIAITGLGEVADTVAVVEKEVPFGHKLPEDRGPNQVLVAVDEVADRSVIKPNAGPGVVHPRREARRKPVLALGLEHVGIAQDAARQLRSRGITRPDKVLLQREQGPGEVEPQLTDRDVVNRILVRQVEVAQDFGPVTGGDRMGAKRVVGQDPRDRLEDDVVLRVARGLEDVALVFDALAQKWAHLEAGDPLPQIEGQRRGPGQRQRQQTDRDR